MRIEFFFFGFRNFVRFVIVGGGNAAGYAARTFVENGMADGRLCIVTKEVNSKLDGLSFFFFITIAFGFCSLF